MLQTNELPFSNAVIQHKTIYNVHIQMLIRTELSTSHSHRLASPSSPPIVHPQRRNSRPFKGLLSSSLNTILCCTSMPPSRPRRARRSRGGRHAAVRHLAWPSAVALKRFPNASFIDGSTIRVKGGFKCLYLSGRHLNVYTNRFNAARLLFCQ